MELRLKNIGPISTATIELTGLTVIGGLNDTGKSTIGKCLFSIVKAVRNRELEYVSFRRLRVDTLSSDFVSSLRRISSISISPSLLSSLVRRVFDIDNFDIDVDADLLEGNLSEVKERISTELSHREFTSGRRLSTLGKVEESPLFREQYIDIFIDSLRLLVSQRKDVQGMYATSFENVIGATFRGEINNQRANDQKGIIELIHSSTTILSSSFEKNRMNQMIIKEEALTDLFEDATLLESPFVLNFRPSLNYFRGSYENPFNIAYTTSDLLQKLTFATSLAISQNDAINNSLGISISRTIGETIKGKIYFNQEKDDFFFLGDDKIEVRIANTASGVKTLGIIQMLATAGILNGTNLLIIDEPEVHLHPAWQLVCADVIATLVTKYNVYCVVSSHSPYFLQALEAYTKYYKMDHLTKFYLSEKTVTGCTVRDITSDLEPLYDLLAEPMERIAYLQTRTPKPQND